MKSRLKTVTTASGGGGCRSAYLPWKNQGEIGKTLDKSLHSTGKGATYTD